MKILAAMSGGVDSAVAAARAVEAGHEVVGVHLALSRMPGTLRTGSRGCCTRCSGCSGCWFRKGTAHLRGFPQAWHRREDRTYPPGYCKAYA